VTGAADGHYFEAQPAVRSAPRQVSLVLPDRTVDLVTDRGVFAADAIDAGTKFLLSDGPAIAPGSQHLLDLGCGYGPIATTLAWRHPDAVVWAIDVNRRALDLCRANTARLGLPNVEVCEPGDVPADVRFDAVWSNPPIRIGKAALHDLLTTWLDRLAREGRACLVVQKHLGADSLHRWLEQSGWPTARLASRAGYRLLDVERRTAGSISA
jgi:16S rRNA (guanine1207-N2)-methyltransferase